MRLLFCKETPERYYTTSMIRNVIIDGNNHVSICLYRADSNLRKDAPDKLDEYLPGAIRKLYLAMLRKLQRDFGEFSNYYIAWDAPGGSAWRKEIVKSYKAGRSHHKALQDAIQIGKSIAEELMITNVEIDGAEADDTIYALCRELDGENIVISRDHDMIQIVQTGFAKRVFDPVSKKDLEIPSYDIVDFKALVGDSSDNIPGVKNIGPSKAIKILENGGIGSLTSSLYEEVSAYKKIISLCENPRYPYNAAFVKKLIEESV